MINQNYLTRLQQRELEKEVKDCAAFGVITGGILILISGWFAFFSEVNFHLAFVSLFIISLITFIIGIIIPQLLYFPQKILSSIGNFIFSLFFKLLLLILFIFVILPVGLIYKKKGEFSFSSWENSIADTKTEQWTDKTFDYEMANSNKSHNNILFRSLNIVTFFIKKKQWILIPTILAILILALIFSFIQSSMITPLIYTIF